LWLYAHVQRACFLCAIVCVFQHCNVNEKGGICLDSLKDKWSPTLTTKSVLAEIIALLQFPNPDNPLRAEIAKLYKEDKAQHDKNAAEFTRKYAQ